uniref:DUF3956 domain-containing protein n=1 Tax=Heterorhabditis bacteriophora TaxID=37862 RepID=A0A1I7WNS9_HETBA
MNFTMNIFVLSFVNLVAYRVVF